MKYSKQRKKIPFMFALSANAIVHSIGYSIWITGDMLTRDDSIKIEKTSRQPVCYIQDEPTIKYMTIEKALEVAADSSHAEKEDTIVVIPGTNPSITKNCTIDSKDRLIIPVDEEATEEMNYETTANSGETPGNYAKAYLKRFGSKSANFADSKDQSKRVTELKINAGVTLTVNGTLGIAGETGCNNQRPSGQTVGKYSQVTLVSDRFNAAKIDCSGKINCYGYIKTSGYDTGKVTVSGSSSSIYAPFVVYNYRGGGDTSNCYYEKVAPFYDYDFPNIQCTLRIEKKASLIGAATLITGTAQMNSTDIKLISEQSGENSYNSLINFKDESGAVEFKYTPVTNGLTNYTYSGKTANASTAGKTTANLYGNIAISYMSMSLAGYDVSLDGIFFSIPFRYSYTIKNGANIDIETKLKFMTGSYAIVENGATVNINKDVILYSTFENVSDSNPFYPIGEIASYITNDGQLNIKAPFGGLINARATGKIDTISASFSNGCSSKEWEKMGSTADPYLNQVISESAHGTFSDNIDHYFEAGNTYSTINGLWNGVTEHDYSLKFKFNRTKDPKDESFVVSVNDSDSFNISENDATPILLKEGDKFKITKKGNTKATISGLDLGTEYTASSNYNIVISLEANSGCILPTSLVLMSDGTYKQAGLLKVGDEVMSFNHETGKIISNKVIINSHIDEEANLYEVVHLEFENNRKTSLVDEHAYFDIEENKYVYLNKNNARDYIGHRFVFIDSKLNRFDLKLEKVTIEKMLTKLAAPVSAYHLNVIVDDMLSIEGAISGLFNVFEYDSKTLTFDKEKMQRDIDKYGLTDYETFRTYFPYEIFEKLLPCKYFDVALGKGLLTWDIIKSYIARWKNQLMQNMK